MNTASVINRTAGATVLVFLKAPREGTVKTRLARELGAAAALDAYRRLTNWQLGRIPREFSCVICFTPDEARGEMRDWLGASRRYWAQGEGDLGARLDRAFARAFAAGAERVLAIGADCSSLSAEDLRHASEQLAGTDLVLGPATDGGYYLVALRVGASTLFRDIPWSTPQVCPQTIARARAEGLSLHLLEPKEDVDDFAAWNRAGAQFPELATSHLEVKTGSAPDSAEVVHG